MSLANAQGAGSGHRKGKAMGNRVDEVIELKDIHGKLVRVHADDALQAVGDMLRDDERLIVPRTREPVRYVCARIIDDSEVPG